MEFANGGIGCDARCGWFRSDDVVLTIGFVPHGNDGGAALGCPDAGGELGFGLVSEAVAYADGEFF